MIIDKNSVFLGIKSTFIGLKYSLQSGFAHSREYRETVPQISAFVP